jgi:hypothetical protein
MSLLAVGQGVQVFTGACIPASIALFSIRGVNLQSLTLKNDENARMTVEQGFVTAICTNLALGAFIGLQGTAWGILGGSLFLLGVSVIHICSEQPKYKQMAPTMATTAVAFFALTVLANSVLGGRLLPMSAVFVPTKTMGLLAGLFTLFMTNPTTPPVQGRLYSVSVLAAFAVNAFASLPTAAAVGVLFGTIIFAGHNAEGFEIAVPQT